MKRLLCVACWFAISLSGAAVAQGPAPSESLPFDHGSGVWVERSSVALPGETGLPCEGGFPSENGEARRWAIAPTEPSVKPWWEDPWGCMNDCDLYYNDYCKADCDELNQDPYFYDSACYSDCQNLHTLCLQCCQGYGSEDDCTRLRETL